MTTPNAQSSTPKVLVLDTNIILRYLMQDNLDLAQRATVSFSTLVKDVLRS
jgi:hypothetical protein